MTPQIAGYVADLEALRRVALDVEGEQCHPIPEALAEADVRLQQLLHRYVRQEVHGEKQAAVGSEVVRVQGERGPVTGNRRLCASRFAIQVRHAAQGEGAARIAPQRLLEHRTRRRELAEPAQTGGK